MARIEPLAPKNGNVLLMVGTTKGAFLFLASRGRARWKAAGPYFPGHAVYTLALDQRGGRGTLWASTDSMHWGAVLRSSRNFGKTWTNPEEANVKFPADTGLALKQIWQVRPGREEEPDVLYCGVEPAALFESRDRGASWKLVRGLFDHPHREKWMPGGGGLCLHTILPDPKRKNRITVAISTGGVYRSDDGGRKWRARNRGVTAEFLPDKHPEFGQCVHKVVQDPEDPDRLFLQNHWGLFRSTDGGDRWEDMANGVPSTFGFPIAMHPHDPETLYVVPLESDQFRAVCDRKLRVYRSRDGGDTWKPTTRGLPQKDAHEVVLRDALVTDDADPAGVYFGTRSGKVYASSDAGTSWRLVHGSLPPVTCVRAAVVRSAASRPRVPKRAGGRPRSRRGR